MDPLGDQLTIRPIQPVWEFTIEPYASGQFWFIDDPEGQFGNGSVWTRTQIRSDSAEPLLTLPDLCINWSTHAVSPSASMMRMIIRSVFLVRSLLSMVTSYWQNTLFLVAIQMTILSCSIVFFLMGWNVVNIKTIQHDEICKVMNEIWQ